ncbi:MAG: hypothetical protein LUO85_00325 [Methanomassiliicoccales archaeon]|nr:hypothetical protein [Methanomassiliicoccales archaeon]
MLKNQRLLITFWMWKTSKACCAIGWLSSFRQEVNREIAREEAMIERLSTPAKGYRLGAVATYALIAISLVVLFLHPNFLLLWLVVALLLYSYNFVFLLIPTSTTKKTSMRERVDLDKQWSQFKDVARHLIVNRKGLALEMALTVFLGGMVPLALSFTVIFGVGLAFAMNYGILSHTIDMALTNAIIIQIVLILLFYVLLMFFAPHAQGMTRIFRNFSTRFDKARSSGKMAIAVVGVLLIGLIAITAVLFFGAILLPGSTLLELIIDPEMPQGLDVLSLAFILGAQVVIMRHFQGLSSRRMAINLLRKRIATLKKDVLEHIDGADPAGLDQVHRDEEIEAARVRYCSMVIYDIAEHSFFGYAPVYMVAPGMRYAKEDKVLSSASFDVAGMGLA